MSNLCDYAENMDTDAKRDCVFIYVWVLAKIVAATSTMDAGDKIYVETALIEGIMGSLEKGNYDASKGHVLGWAITISATYLRDALAHIYVGRVRLVDMSDIPADKRGYLVDKSPPVEELIDISNVEDMIYQLGDDQQVQVLWMSFVDGLSQAEIASVLDISSSKVSRTYLAGLNELNAIHTLEMEGKQDG